MENLNSLSGGSGSPGSAPGTPDSPGSPDSKKDGDSPSEKRSGRRKINIEFIEDKSRRHITFSKRKAGIMKKAYELSTLTGTQVLLLVASETGHVYTFATPKLQPLITKPEGKNLIQACLNAPDSAPIASPPAQPPRIQPNYPSESNSLPQNYSENNSSSSSNNNTGSSNVSSSGSSSSSNSNNNSLQEPLPYDDDKKFNNADRRVKQESKGYPFNFDMNFPSSGYPPNLVPNIGYPMSSLQNRYMSPQFPQPNFPSSSPFPSNNYLWSHKQGPGGGTGNGSLPPQHLGLGPNHNTGPGGGSSASGSSSSSGPNGPVPGQGSGRNSLLQPQLSHGSSPQGSLGHQPFPSASSLQSVQHSLPPSFPHLHSSQHSGSGQSPHPSLSPYLSNGPSPSS